MSNELLRKRWAAVMMDSYGTPPLALVSGSGVRVTDADGAEYLDFIAGIAVSALGHGHPALVTAVSEQAGRLAHTSNLFIHQPGVELAEKLVELAGDDTGRVFFCNDGATANECALKISRLYGRATGRGKVVATEGGFHGRTLGALSITGNPAKREPFGPLPGPVEFIPYGDVDALAAAVDRNTAALFLEPTQGEGGVVPAPPGYLAAARRACTDAGALLVLDEVQSGIGRTGHWFAGLAADVRPDLLTVAKGLGGGLPIGACLAFGPPAGLLTPGSHGSTFGGNPVACAAALAVLRTIEQDGLLEQVTRTGALLATQLRAIDSPLVGSVRGSGLWWGVQLTSDRAAEVVAAAARHGLLVNAVRPDVLRLAPPLVVTEAEVLAAVEALAGALAEVGADLAKERS